MHYIHLVSHRLKSLSLSRSCISTGTPSSLSSSTYLLLSTLAISDQEKQKQEAFHVQRIALRFA